MKRPWNVCQALDQENRHRLFEIVNEWWSNNEIPQKKYSQELSDLPRGEDRSLPLPEIFRDPDLFGGKEDRIPWVEKAFENAEAK